VGLTIIVFIGLVYFYIRLPKTRFERLCRVSLILISAGALGNFICRLLWGNVIDFFYFRLINFPLFNMADIFIVTGCFMLIFAMLFSPAKETDDEPEADAEA
jgi:signal peptidase II